MHGGHMPQQAVVAEDTSNQRDRSGIMRTSLARNIHEGWQLPLRPIEATGSPVVYR